MFDNKLKTPFIALVGAVALMASVPAFAQTAAPAAGDPRLVELLVTNLIDNALRHNVDGGHVEVSTGFARGRTTIMVRNSGPAILPGQIEQLFQPFQRTGGRQIPRTDGHGFGLAIVQAIVKAHGAGIWPHPRPEGGLDIVVSFATPDTAFN